MLDLNFSVDEVFEIAEKIETNGAIFYRKAAEIVDDEAGKAKLLELAEAEDRHEAVFRGMRERLVPDDARISVYDKDDVVALHLQALANREVFVTDENVGDVLNGDESMADIIRLAISKEWDSILFYSAIRDLMETDSDRNVLNDIIRQEEIHVKDLQAVK